MCATNKNKNASKFEGLPDYTILAICLQCLAILIFHKLYELRLNINTITLIMTIEEQVIDRTRSCNYCHEKTRKTTFFTIITQDSLPYCIMTREML